MAPSTLPTIALLAFTYIFYRLIHGFITGRRFRKFAKQHGCEEPLDTTGSFPYGWETVLRLMCVHTSEPSSRFYHPSSSLSSILCSPTYVF